MRLASEAAAADIEAEGVVPEAVEEEEEITEPMVAVHMEAALVEAATGQCHMDPHMVGREAMVEAMAILAMDGGNPLTHPSCSLKLRKAQLLPTISLLFLRFAMPNLFAPTHRNRQTPNNPLKMDRLISLPYLSFSQHFPFQH